MAAPVRPTALSRQFAGSGDPIPYTLRRSARRRRTISLSLDEHGAVRVAAPLRVTQAEIDAFLAARETWLRAHLQRHTERPGPRYADGATIPFRGSDVTICLVPSAAPTTPRVTLFETVPSPELHVALPASAGVPPAPAAVHAAIVDWCVAQARVAIPWAVLQWQSTMGLSPRAVHVRDQQRRWGSCAPDGTLRFNWRLVLAPPRILDYVAVHELAHLRHPNHSPAFWAEVARYLPDVATLRRELRESAPRFQLPPPC